MSDCIHAFICAHCGDFGEAPARGPKGRAVTIDPNNWQDAWRIFQAEREKGYTSKVAFNHMIRELLPPKESAPAHDGAVGDARKRKAEEGQPEGSERCVRCGKDVTGTPWSNTDEWNASHYCIRCLHGAPPGESEHYTRGTCVRVRREAEHLADVTGDSCWLRERLADAWDEGWKAFEDHAAFDWVCPVGNPYRGGQ